MKKLTGKISQFGFSQLANILKGTGLLVLVVFLWSLPQFLFPMEFLWDM
jgi:hypothetical protein